LNPECDEPLSNFATNFKLRRYMAEAVLKLIALYPRQGLTLVHFSAQPETFVFHWSTETTQRSHKR